MENEIPKSDSLEFAKLRFLRAVALRCYGCAVVLERSLGLLRSAFPTLVGDDEVVCISFEFESNIDFSPSVARDCELSWCRVWLCSTEGDGMQTADFGIDCILIQLSWWDSLIWYPRFVCKVLDRTVGGATRLLSWDPDSLELVELGVSGTKSQLFPHLWRLILSPSNTTRQNLHSHILDGFPSSWATLKWFSIDVNKASPLALES